MNAAQRDALRREIDRVRRGRLVQAEIDKAEYRIEHRVGGDYYVAKNEAKLSGLRQQQAELGRSPDGRCLAILDVGKRWTHVLAVRCSRSATTGRFCRTHERRRVGEIVGAA